MTAISMTPTFQDKVERIEMQKPTPKTMTKKCLSLLMWVGLIWAFAFVFAPWLQRQSTTVQTLSTYIDESGIDAGAVYYTEVDEVSDADLMIRDTFRFFIPQQEK